MKRTLLALGLCTVFMSNVNAAQWGYEGQHGPSHWGEFASECANGVNQSPINIESATEANLEKLSFDYQGQVVSLLNNGHTLQTQLEGINTLVIDGKSFTLKQFHFHTPSENHVDGKEYPLEAHFVHADKAGHLAVVAVFFELGDDNSELAKLLDNIPEKGADLPIDVPFNASALLSDTNDYYRFSGSLTTPPCSEGVRWLVLKTPQTVSAKQAALFNKIMGNNNRPLQKLNARLITQTQ